MNWLSIIAVVTGLALAFTLGLYVNEIKTFTIGSVTGLAVAEVSNENTTQLYAWTTALCGTDDRCIDVLVHCNGTQILNLTPISAAIWHSEEWQDPRGGNPEALCR